MACSWMTRNVETDVWELCDREGAEQLPEDVRPLFNQLSELIFGNLVGLGDDIVCPYHRKVLEQMIESKGYFDEESSPIE